MLTPKNHIFGYVFSLFVGTAIVTTPQIVQSADNLVVQDVPKVKTTPVTWQEQEALTREAAPTQKQTKIPAQYSLSKLAINALNERIEQKDKEMEKMRKEMEIQRKQIQNADLYKQAQSSQTFKKLNVAHLDFELIKKQEDLARQTRNLAQQQEWLEKERLNLRKMQKSLSSDNETQKELLNTQKRLINLERKYKAEQHKLQQDNAKMQKRLAEIQAQHRNKPDTAIKTPVISSDSSARSERKLIAIQKRHEKERQQLLADKKQLETRLAKIQSSQQNKIANAQTQSDAEHAKAAEQMAALKKQHDAERQKLLSDKQRLEQRLAEIKSAQKQATNVVAQSVSEQERAKANAQIAALKKQHEAEQQQLLAEKAKLERNLATLQSTQSKEVQQAKSASLKERERTTQQISALKKQYEAEQQQLLKDKRQLEERLMSIQASKSDDVARVKAESEKERAKAAQQMAALEKQHNIERQALLQENQKMQERLANIHSAQRAAAHETRSHARTKEDLQKAEAEIQKLKQKHEKERQDLIRNSTEMQKRLASLHSAQQEDAAKENLETLSKLSEAKKQMQLAVRKYETERQKLIAENRALQQQLVQNNTAQQQQATQAAEFEKAEKAKVLSQLMRAEKHMEMITRQYEAERQALVRENKTIQDQLAAAQSLQSQLLETQEKLRLLEEKQTQDQLQFTQSQQTIKQSTNQETKAIQSALLKEQERMRQMQTQHEAERNALLQDNAAIQKRLADVQEQMQQATARPLAQTTEGSGDAELRAELKRAEETIALLQNQHSAERQALQQNNKDIQAKLVELQSKQKDISRLENEVQTLQSQRVAVNTSLTPIKAVPQKAEAPVQAKKSKKRFGITIPGGYADTSSEDKAVQTEPQLQNVVPQAEEKADIEHIANIAPAAGNDENDPYSSFLDNIMQVHRGERAPTELRGMEPSKAVLEQKKREAQENAVSLPEKHEPVTMMPLPDTTPVAAVQPHVSSKPALQPAPTVQKRDITAKTIEAPLSDTVIQTSAAAKPLSAVLHQANIPATLIEYDSEHPVQKWNLDFANGMFEQQPWPTKDKSVSTYDLAGEYLARYNLDCDKKLRVVANRSAGPNTRTIYASCQNPDNMYDAAFVFYGLPQQSFSVFAHVAQPGYTTQLKNVTESLTQAVASSSGKSIYVDDGGGYFTNSKKAAAPVNINQPTVIE